MSNLDENKALVRDFVEALGRLDTEKFLSYLSDDVMFETMGEISASGVKTKAEVAREFPALQEILPNGLKLTIDSMAAEGDKVHLEVSGKSRTIDGEDYNNNYAYFIVIRGGKIVSFREYLNAHLVVRVLGPALARHGATQADRVQARAHADMA